MNPEIVLAAVAGPIGAVIVALITLMGNRRTHRRVEEVSEQLKTNHGSKSTGDAIDRITEVVWDVQTQMRKIVPVVMSDSQKIAQLEQANSSQVELFAEHASEAEDRDVMIASQKRALEQLTEQVTELKEVITSGQDQ